MIPRPPNPYFIRSCDSCDFAEKTNSKTYPVKCTISKPIPMMVHEFCIQWFGYVGCASHSSPAAAPVPEKCAYPEDCVSPADCPETRKAAAKTRADVIEAFGKEIDKHTISADDCIYDDEPVVKISCLVKIMELIQQQQPRAGGRD